MSTTTKSKFDFAIACVTRARKELDAHEKAKAEHSYWYSGHKGKTFRAIQTTQELLQEIKNELQEEN